MTISIKEISSAALYKWRETVEMAGIIVPPTAQKFGPCPICGGKDRFRFDDKEGRGTWICNQCGAGDGISLVQKVTGKTMREMIPFLASLLGISNEAPLDRAAIERNLKQAEARAAETKAKEASQREAAAALANLMADESLIIDAAEHPYLSRKGYTGFGVFILSREYLHHVNGKRYTYRAGCLLHAIRDVNGEIIGAELVRDDGHKTALAGGSKAGFTIIEPPVDMQLEEVEALFVCEGVATGYAIRELLEFKSMGFAALSKNNLMKAAKMARAMIPELPIIVCGDVGAEKEAEAAAAAIGAEVSFPPSGGDWDDYRMEMAA